MRRGKGETERGKREGRQGGKCGDEYDIRTETRKWRVKVTGLLANRQAFSEAVKYYIDLTPEEDLDLNKRMASSFDTGKRQSKIGRPTKKERRDLDDFMQED